MRWSGAYPLLVGAALGALACGLRVPGTGPATCEPAEGEPVARDVETADLAGTYELTLEATAGDSAGARADGRLWLERNPPELRSLPAPGGGQRSDAIAPLYGATDIHVERLGGLRLGDLTSRDPMRPGVLMVSQRDRIILRLGSEGNRRGVLRFDGGYFALRVKRVDETGFYGDWASGTVETAAEGHFCARRELE